MDIASGRTSIGATNQHEGNVDMSNNWDDMGLTWSVESVSRQHGPNASDRREIGKAYIPIIVDLKKFVAAFGEEIILAVANGTSIRVHAQDVNRTAIEKGLGREYVETRMVNWFRGQRTRSMGTVTVVKEVKVYALPNGTTYTGNDLDEYRQQWVAAMVDMGVDADKAIAMAENVTL